MELASSQVSSPKPSAVRVPYGHACSNCVRAKRRCIVRDNASICERCQQQWKSCSLSRSSLSSSEKTREGKVTSPHQHGKILQLPPPDEAAVPKPLSYPSETGDHRVQVNGLSHNNMTLDQCQDCLKIFRLQHLKFFPFVYIPQTTTPAQLQQKRPLLWMSIQAICTESLVQQEALGIRIREVLVHQLLVDGERNIDLLLCLLAVLAWSRYFARGKPFLCMYSDLASSLVIDLGFDRPARDDSELASHSTKKRHVPAHVRTHEERRAFLACFIINSVVSSVMRFDTSKRWSPPIDECLQGLSDHLECPGDAVLVALSGFTRITERAAWGLFPGLRSGNVEAGCTTTLSIESLRIALDRVKENLEPQLFQNKSILSYLHSTNTFISETVLLQRQPSATCQALGSEQLRILSDGLMSAKSQIENYLSFEPEQYLGMDMALVMQFRHSVQMVYRLSLLDDPGWDRAAVSNTIDLIHCLEQAAQKLEQTSKITASTGNSAAHGVISKALTGLRASIPTRDAVLESSETLPRNIQMLGDPNAETQDAISWLELGVSMEDETWLTEALSAYSEWGD